MTGNLRLEALISLIEFYGEDRELLAQILQLENIFKSLKKDDDDG